MRPSVTWPLSHFPVSFSASAHLLSTPVSLTSAGFLLAVASTWQAQGGLGSFALTDSNAVFFLQTSVWLPPSLLQVLIREGWLISYSHHVLTFFLYYFFFIQHFFISIWHSLFIVCSTSKMCALQRQGLCFVAVCFVPSSVPRTLPGSHRHSINICWMLFREVKQLAQGSPGNLWPKPCWHWGQCPF